MSASLRQKQILDIIEESGAVSVRALVKMLYVSEATVRRDLAELEKQGAIKRNFGGAVSTREVNRQVPLFIREALNSSSKNEICRKAAELVKDGDTVFIDGSSTAQHLVKYISHLKDITVVTYSIKTAELTCQSHIKTYCVGGLLLENSLVCTGHKAIELAQSFNTDVCFVSCKGFSADGRFTDTSEEETSVRHAFMKNSRCTAMLMTSNKYGNVYLHTLCRAEDVDFVFSETDVPTAILEKLKKNRD